MQEQIVKEIVQRFINTSHIVLVEGEGREDGTMCARLDNNLAVDFKGGEDLLGKFVNVKIIAAKGANFIGEML